MNKTSCSKAEAKAKDLIFKAKTKTKATTFKAKGKTTNYCKRQRLLLKQSTALHYGNAEAMINVGRCILTNV